MGKKVVSFSLWGTNRVYTEGAVQNSELVKKLYGEDWIARFYIDKEFSNQNVIDRLKKNGAEIIFMDMDKGHSIIGMTWRFLPTCDPTVSVTLSRDADSRITAREVAGVRQWLSSDCIFHVIRDNPAHCIPILGGTWGCKGQIPNMKEQIDHWKSTRGFRTKGDDQHFLNRVIWPTVATRAMCHDAYCRSFGERIRRHLNPPKLQIGYVGSIVAV